VDKIYGGFGPLASLQNPKHAAFVLDSFRDMARLAQAQRTPPVVSGNPAAPKASPAAKPAAGSQVVQESPLKKEAEGWMSSGKTYLISIGGRHYNALPPSMKRVVLNYYLSRLSGSGVLGNKEDAIKWAFRSTPGVLGGVTGERAVAAAVNIINEELGSLPALQADVTPKATPSAPAVVQESAPAAMPQAKDAQTVIAEIKSLPTAPAVSDQVLIQMIISDNQQYWFNSGKPENTGFYGPYENADSKFWAEVDYDAASAQYKFTGRYAIISKSLITAMKQALAGQATA
jgi:hypothetical protein